MLNGLARKWSEVKRIFFFPKGIKESQSLAISDKTLTRSIKYSARSGSLLYISISPVLKIQILLLRSKPLT
jgi:hypothetical protein